MIFHHPKVVEAAAASPAAHGGVTTAVPWDLYTYIQETLALMKHLKTHKNDEKSKSKLSLLRTKIKITVRYHKTCEEIPHDWSLDLTTAHTLVPRKIRPPSENFYKPRSSSRKAHGCCPPPLTDKNRVFHAFNIPLKGDDMDIWMNFRSSVDKHVPETEAISCKHFEKHKIPLIHPIVDVIGRFAFSAFNKSCHLYYKKDVPENLQEMQIMECKYIKMDTYFFYLRIEAIEDGNFGVYEAKVIISPSGGKMTLGRFVLINRGKRSGKHFGTSNPDDWLDPEDDFYAGLVSRDEQDVSQGFDYLCPFGSSGL